MELIPQLAAHPAGAPLTRPSQLELAQPHLHAILGGVFRNRTIGGIQRQLPRLLPRGIKDLDDFSRNDSA